MSTYFIEIFNCKDEIFRTYYVTAESKHEAITRVIKNQIETTNTPRFQILVTEVRVDA